MLTKSKTVKKSHDIFTVFQFCLWPVNICYLCSVDRNRHTRTLSIILARPDKPADKYIMEQANQKHSQTYVR